MKLISPAPSASAFACLRHYLRDPATGWSLGTFGAFAEFSRSSHEKVTITETPDAIQAISERGAIHIENHPQARILPYEILSKLENAWSQGVVVCLPESSARSERRSIVTGLGQDPAPLTPVHETARLFDLGFNVPHIDFCIRSDNPHLIKILNARPDQTFFSPGDTLATAVHDSSPTRVFISRLGRIEVYQDIQPDGEGANGPSTLWAAELLAHNRTHAANLPVPAGWVPCLAFFPPNAIRTQEGGIQTFDTSAHDHFQDLLMRYAEPGIVSIKTMVREALAGRHPPETCRAPESRAERTALRVALRQWHHTNGPSDILESWKVVYEPGFNKPQ